MVIAIVCIVFDIPVRFLSERSGLPDIAFERTFSISGNAETPALVQRVIDGDTFDVRLMNGETEGVRIRGIDTPELGGAGCDMEYQYGMDAKKLAETLLTNKRVILHVSERDKRDPYGRLLANVELPDGRDFGAEMLASRLSVRWPNNYDWCRSRRP